MIVTPLKTRALHANETSLVALLNEYLPLLEEGMVVAISSKIVSLCEGRVTPAEGADREALMKQEASLYVKPAASRYRQHFTIARHTLIGSAGIDSSNGDGNFILWPADPQATANQVRRHLREKHHLKNLGVLITDSCSVPFRLGAIGLAIAASGFELTRPYIGTPDLFGRPFAIERADVAGGLAAAATLVMGEGSEQTPLAVIQEVPHLTFVDRDPTPEDLATFKVTLEEDLFAPFWQSLEWEQGGGQ